MRDIDIRRPIEPARFSLAVRLLAEELRQRMYRHVLLEEDFLSGDEDVELQSLLVVCAVLGLSPSDYLFAIESDERLYQLHQFAVTEAICGTTDPGPYDRISRESPSGSERNEHLNGWMLRGNSP